MSPEYLFELIIRYIESSPYDVMALLWFLACWFGYSFYIDNYLRSSHGLSARMHLFRVQWLLASLQRENRVVDANIIQSYQSSISFLASTAILIIAGLMAMLSSASTALAIINQIPFAAVCSKFIWYCKNFLLIYLFIYAFFKLTWALRQLNYCMIMVGGMPIVHDSTKLYEYTPLARRTAMVTTMAVKDMNRGIRAYYFAIAVLAWFLNPLLFVITTAWVMVVLYRREFKSKIIHVMNMPSHTESTSLQNARLFSQAPVIHPDSSEHHDKP